jgi:hypothetical protein
MAVYIEYMYMYIPWKGTVVVWSDPTEHVALSNHLRAEAVPVSETLCFLVFGIPDVG